MTKINHNQALNKLLVIDTSTAVMSIALMDGEHLISEDNQIVERSHSNKLLPAIHELISAQGLSMQEIDGVAVGCGPGSYTGVRIGITAAKTFAWSLGIPLIGVSSLEALAYGEINYGFSQANQTNQADERTNKRNQWIIPLMDARRTQVYTGLYKTAGNQWDQLKKDQILLVDEWVEQVIAYHEELAQEEQPVEIKFIGEIAGLMEHLKHISELWPEKVRRLEKQMRAADLGILAQRRYGRGEQEEIHTLVPNYTQLAEAEANLKINQK